MSAGAAVAFAAIAILYLLYGDILTGNLAGVSAELQVRLINDIVEVKSLPQIVQIMPEQWFATAGYSAVLIAAGYWALRRSAVPQPQLATIYVMMVLAILASFYQFRLLRTGIVASIPVSVAIVSALADILKQRLEKQKTRLLIIVPAATLVFLQPVWLAAGLAFAAAGKTAEAGNSPASASMAGTDPETKQALPEWRKGPIYPLCNLQSQYGFLAKLPPGLVLNDLNSGPPILVFTGHPVLAGNYHRNGKAILQTLDFFETSEHKARAIARETGAAYVGFCATGQPIPRGSGHDGKLASRILRGKPPAWLQQISPPGDRFIVLKVLKDKQP